MRNVARLPESDRRELFRNTADKMGLNDAIVEKDFWVCFTLDYLFHRCPWKETITFKGGTSLSKAFNLISRFSEDIDLILDWRVLGRTSHGKNVPTPNRIRSTKKPMLGQRFFLRSSFVPPFRQNFLRSLAVRRTFT